MNTALLKHSYIYGLQYSKYMDSTIGDEDKSEVMQWFTAPLFLANPKADDWDFFQCQFSNYTAIVEAKEEQKLPLFLKCLGRDSLMLNDGLPAPKTSYVDADVVVLLDAHQSYSSANNFMRHTKGNRSLSPTLQYGCED